jgi:hypothetical protein
MEPLITLFKILVYWAEIIEKRPDLEAEDSYLSSPRLRMRGAVTHLH